MRKITFLSCLSDAGANIKGSAAGPFVIKKELLNDHDVKKYVFYEYKSEKEHKASQIKEIVQDCSQDYDITLINNEFPILLGGDHSFAMASISSCSNFCEKKGIPLYVFWFDAHADIHTTKTSETGNIHGMPVAMLAGLDGSGLILKNKKYIDLNNFYLFGVRSIDKEELNTLNKNNISYVNDNFEKSLDLLRKAIASAPANSYFHISFDVDCLSPFDAPGVSTPENGGYKIEEAIILLHELIKDKRTKSLDIMEYNPLYENEKFTTLRNVRKIINLLIK